MYQFVAFDMVILHYEIRICQKSITELQVTIKVNVWYEIACIKRYKQL